MTNDSKGIDNLFECTTASSLSLWITYTTSLCTDYLLIYSIISNKIYLSINEHWIDFSPSSAAGYVFTIDK